MGALLWLLFAWSPWAQTSTEVVGTTGETGYQVSDRLVCLDLASHYVGGHDSQGRCSYLCCLVRLGVSLPLFWRTLQVRSLLWPLFACSALVQPATVVAGTAVDGAALSSVHLIGVGLARPSGGGHCRRGRSSALCSLGRRELSQPLWWRARQLRALLSVLVARSAWSQKDT